MIRLNKVVIVEGIYDKIKLESIIDGIIIVLNGFGIYKNEEMKSLIKHYAFTKGILIMTDSDNAGLQLRNYIASLCKDGKVYHAYIPEIEGKEKRKDKSSAQGFLGVEGIKRSTIEDAIVKSGALNDNDDIIVGDITTADLYNLGLFGTANSKAKRIALLKSMNLPTNLSKNSLLKILNKEYTYTDLENKILEIEE